MRKNSLRLCLLGLAGLWVTSVLAAATVKVDGAGLWRDRGLRTSLERLLNVEKKKEWDANAIEDAAVILAATLGDEGFQAPRIEIEAIAADGSQQRFDFDPTFARPLPRSLTGQEVIFRLTPGVRSHVDRVEFEGLTAVTPDNAEAYFRLRNTLFATERANAYSPARVNRAADALQSELRQQGYVAADVQTDKISEVDGAVTIRVTVHEGAKWIVKSVRFQDGDTPEVTLPAVDAWLERPWAPTLQVDIREAARRVYYERGYPDVGVHVEAEGAPARDGQVEASVVVTIVSGGKVTIGAVRFEGNKVTSDPVLRRRVDLGPGSPLNPLLLERARYRISHLGIFDTIDLRYAPEDGPKRDAIFSLRESLRAETSVLLGYGSYEQLRAGIEHRQINLFGRGHQSTIQVVQSLKSTSGDYSYAVPELFGESLDGTARLFGLQRKEIAFLRQEFGLNLSLRKGLAAIGGEATVGYTFQALRNRQNSLSTRATDDTQLNAASVTLGVSGDRRDSRLRPRKGYHWSTQAEVADERLGGQAAYQRFEVSGAYHTGWGGGRWLHVGLSHGVVTTLGTDDRTLPVNKRFFPGGDNSIRGYQRGEAAPRGADGLFFGAKAYLLLNLELEQALTSNWSLVAFGDTLGMAPFLRDYPFSERLYSAGLGVRYQTIIGPLRLEYGRNLNPRPADPPGTWQFSMGYPF